MRSIDMKGGSKFSRTASDSRAMLPDWAMTQLLVMRMVLSLGKNEEQSGTLSLFYLAFSQMRFLFPHPTLDPVLIFRTISLARRM